MPTPRSTARRVSAIPMLAAALGVTLQERFLPYHGGLAGDVGRHERTFAQLCERM
ncbi:MAG TPA: hypothetical protein VHG53_00455 [Candidatus Limnocylindria bacterium]|nr:hypothetical protein [Candidatus Limnocylindria bacterium]